MKKDQEDFNMERTEPEDDTSLSDCGCDGDCYCDQPACDCADDCVCDRTDCDN